MIFQRRVLEPAILVLLVALLAVLAVLQVRWVSKAASADEERMSASIARAAKQLTAAISDQLSVLQFLFQVDPADTTDRRTENLAASLAFWNRNAPHPDLVKGVALLVRDTGERPAITWLNPASAEFGSVPAGIRPALDALAGRLFPSETSPELFLADISRYLDVPALVIPVFGKTTTTTSAAAKGAVTVGELACVAVLLDRNVLVSEVLPGLVQDSFNGDLDLRDYLVTLVDLRAGTTLYPPTGAEHTAAAMEQADLVVPVLPGTTKVLLFSKSTPAGEEPSRNLDLVQAFNWVNIQRAAPEASTRSVVVAGPGPVAKAGGVFDVLTPAASEPSGWVLEVRHRAGSIHEAARQQMLRGLAVSLGILLVLGASLALLAVAFRRARAASQTQREFVATVSHELRTPLSAICAAGENLSDGIVRDEAKVRDYGRIIRGEGRRLRDMVEKVLALSRDRPVSRRAAHGVRRRAAADTRAGGADVEMAGVVRAAAAGLAPVCASRGIRLEVEVPAQLIVRGGDADELAAAVRNLVDNAVLHGGSGGLVRAALELHRGRRGDEARVSVSDRGPGIPRAELARLFEPFVRGSAAVAAQLPGSGLGLAIVDRAARRHGGTVMVESSPGRGTTFTIVLPLRRGRKV